MEQYTGTKTLGAKPMTRGEYNEYRGWTLPADENAEDPGYLVEYTDGGKANDSRHAGYISWSPADVFERTYRPTTATPPPAVGSDQAIEREIVAKGLTAPRVTKDHIDSMMARVQYVGGRVDETTSTVMHAFLDGSFLLASGHSACVSAENFNAELGFDMAKSQAEAKARDQLWLLEGYALRSRLAGPTDAMVQRFLQWPVPAHIHPDGTPGQPGRTGTNLLDALTAKEMLVQVLAG